MKPFTSKHCNSNFGSPLKQSMFKTKSSVVETPDSKLEKLRNKRTKEQQEYRARVDKLTPKQKDSLRIAAYDDYPNTGFYSKKHGVYVEAEDGVLVNKPGSTDKYPID